MGKNPDRKNASKLRTLLAQEAARLVCDHGYGDYRGAKLKAAENLGLAHQGALPNNREIELAVAERNRIFDAEHSQTLLQQLRQVAINVMLDLQPFQPRLVGSVLSGNITEHTAIKLHLFSDPAESVGMNLVASSVQHKALSFRLRLQRNTVELFPGYSFYSANHKIEATIFPERRQRHAPLSPIDGRPMKRARLEEVEYLTTG